MLDGPVCHFESRMVIQPDECHFANAAKNLNLRSSRKNSGSQARVYSKLITIKLTGS
jgi:hypothetical protein